MKIALVALIFAIGFMAGALLFRARTVHAQHGGGIYVTKTSIGAFTAPPGFQVVGFSCTSDESGPTCFVATQ